MKSKGEGDLADREQKLERKMLQKNPESLQKKKLVISFFSHEDLFHCVIARIQIDRKLIKTHIHCPMGQRQTKGVYNLIDPLFPDIYRCKQQEEDKPGPT